MFADLPYEMHRHIATYLPIADALSFTATSKQFSDIAFIADHFMRDALPLSMPFLKSKRMRQLKYVDLTNIDVIPSRPFFIDDSYSFEHIIVRCNGRVYIASPKKIPRITISDDEASEDAFLDMTECLGIFMNTDRLDVPKRFKEVKKVPASNMFSFLYITIGAYLLTSINIIIAASLIAADIKTFFIPLIIAAVFIAVILTGLVGIVVLGRLNGEYRRVANFV